MSNVPRRLVSSWILVVAAAGFFVWRLPSFKAVDHESAAEPFDWVEGKSLAIPANPAAPQGYVSGGGQRLTFNDYAQDETSIAADPHHPDVVIGGFKDFGYFSANRFSGPGVVFSSDGGATFASPTAPIALPSSFDSLGGDPSVAFDSQGRALYLDLCAGGPGDPNRGSPPTTHNNGLFLSTSTNGGQTWSAPTTVTSNLWDGNFDVPFEDKPYIAADDYVGSPFQDRIYVSWTRFYPGNHPNGGFCPNSNPLIGGGDIMIARSEDHGSTWSYTRLTDNGHEPGNTGFCTSFGVGSTCVQGSDIEVAPNGDVYVAFWFNPRGSVGGRVECARSTDGGVTFGALTHPFGAAQGNDQIPTPLPNESFRTNSFPNVETDPTRPGYVYIVAADDDDTPTAADASNIFLVRSTDNGATWGARLKLNDDGLDRNQVFPWMAVNDVGDILVLWYDSREDPNNHLLGIYYTLSTDGGTTWTPNERLTESFEPNTNQFSSNFFFGDYIGAAGVGDHFHALWTDTRRPGSLPEQEVYYARIQPGVAAVGNPPGAAGLSRPHPNPSAAGVRFEEMLPKDGVVRMRILDVSGRLVGTLDQGRMGAGRHAFAWDGSGADGRRVAPGAYFVRLESPGFESTRKVVMLR